VDELNLEIAGLRAAIFARDPEVAKIVRERYRGFLSAATPSATPGWRIDMDTAPTRSVGNDVVVTREGGPTRYHVTRGDLAGTIDLGERWGTVSLTRANEFSIDSFLRIAYSLALVDADGLVVHAASLIRRGRAFLFCGRSGSGKTTVARLSRDATLLSDELSIVRVTDRRARCYGTPFWGELAKAGEDRVASLHAMYFLHHGTRHAVEVLRPRQALERLLPNVLFFARDADLPARVLGIAAALVDAVPSFDLTFCLDAGFWEVIDHA
jgi:hypothetical protein